MRDSAAPSLGDFALRQALKRAITAFFDERNYVELEPPILVVTPGTEVHLDYFASSWRDHYGRDFELFLRSSPELHLKQALAQGLRKVWHLGKCFRNYGERSLWHHPEFTMLEWYEAGVSFDAFMAQTAELIRFAIARLQALDFAPKLTLPPEITKMTVAAAIERFAGITLVDQDEGLAHRAIQSGILSVRPDDDFETAFFKILLDRVEPGLKDLGAVFLYDYPPSQAALAKVEGGVAKRFELYIHGIEVCNAFLELTQPEENAVRIKKSQALRATLGKQVVPEDEEFYGALATGLPASCGNALGFDRLLALIMGHSNLDRAIPFRDMHPYHLGPPA